MYCSICGKEITDDSRFCRHCGHVSIGATKNVTISEDIARWTGKIKNMQFSLKTILLAIAAGIWMLVLQNLGIIPVSRNVKITDQKGNIEVWVRGGSLDIDNTVDVNLTNY